MGAWFNKVVDMGFSFGVGDLCLHMGIEVSRIKQVIGDVFSAELGEVGIEENGWFAQFLSQCASPSDGIGEFGVVFVGSQGIGPQENWQSVEQDAFVWSMQYLGIEIAAHGGFFGQ